MHILNTDGIIIQTTQKNFAGKNLKNVIGFPLSNFLLRSDLTSFNTAIERITKTGIPQWLGYTINDESHIAYLDRIEDDVIVVHECKEIDIKYRPMVKRKLFLSSSRWYKKIKKREF
jgi:hypothetical protein